MSSLRLTLCTGAVLAAAFTPTAYAADAGVSVSPASPAPGSDIQLRAPGCAGRAGTAVSDAFVADAQLTGTGKDGGLVGETRVRSSLTPGTYDIEISCDGRAGIKGTVAVNGAPKDALAVNGAPKDALAVNGAPKDAFAVNGAPEDAPTSQAYPSYPAYPGMSTPAYPGASTPAFPFGSMPANPAASVPASPIAPVHAGGGGTAHLASADAKGSGPGTRQAVIGLVLAGVAAVAVAVRSARRGRGSAD